MSLDEAQARIAMLHEALQRLSDGDMPVHIQNHAASTIAATAEQVDAWRASVESAARADETLRTALDIDQAIRSDACERGPHDRIGKSLRERDARVRAKALEEAMAHFRKTALNIFAGRDCVRHVLEELRALAAEPTPRRERPDAHAPDCDIRRNPREGESTHCTCGESLGVARMRPTDDPHSPAFYRVGQTGVERALPVADSEPKCGSCGSVMEWRPASTAFAYFCPKCSTPRLIAPAAKPEACATCHGSGRLTNPQGEWSWSLPICCPDCGGTGRAR